MSCPKKMKRRKPKTHKGIAKRVKITATGKVKMGRPGRRHLAISKSPKRLRHLRRKITIGGKLAKYYRNAVKGHY